MKLLSTLVAALVLGSALAPVAHARPGGLGPSAIEAAHLKYSPPLNFLSHYLPDDRYKIAGGVWKFVSTDLDTYYHVPSSPNMMRQPADRVIGFASVRDAEEAGYSADPSDGTASVAASSRMMSLPGGGAVSGSNVQETRYLNRVIPLLLRARNDATALGQRFSTTMQRAGQSGRQVATPVMARQMMSQLLRQTRSTVINFERIQPPARFRRFHSLLAQSLRDSNSVVYTLNRMATTGNLGGLMQMQSQVGRFQQTDRQLRAEAQRLGLASQLQQVMGPMLSR